MKDRNKIYMDAWNKWITTERGKAMTGHIDDGVTGMPFVNILMLTFRAGLSAGLDHATGDKQEP